MKFRIFRKLLDISPLLKLSFICVMTACFAGCNSSEPLQQEQQQTVDQPPAPTPDTAPPKQTEAKQDDQIITLKKKYRQQLIDEYNTEANKIITFYLQAQRRFYEQEYEDALDFINKALNIREIADAYALKGSIYLGLGDTENFRKNWQQALQMDQNIPLPRSDYIIEELQNNGLLNENFEPTI